MKSSMYGSVKDAVVFPVGVETTNVRSFYDVFGLPRSELLQC